MLKRLVRHRLFQVLLALVIAAAGIWVPIRHDYTFDQYPGVTCDKDCGYGNQTTDVYYGVPFTWLKLTKTVSQYDQHVVSQHRQETPKFIAIDLVSYGAAYAVGWAGNYAVKARRRANLGN